MNISIVIPTLDNPDDVANVIESLNLQSLLPSVVDYIIENVADTQLYINQSQNMHIKRSKLNICIIRIDPNLAC